ncbi:MAG: histidine triad nucleotide-binding protein [Gammaproteobacteria bacterium]
MDADCLFCKIVSGTIASEQVYQDDDIISFKDIAPKAPTHLLIIPKRHIATLNDAKTDALLLGHMTATAIHLAKQFNFAQEGYRLVWNCNQYGGQEIYHIHLHLLGGRVLTWPPG